MKVSNKAYRPKFDVSVFQTDKVANEVLYQMEESAVLLGLVHRDFEDQIQSSGNSVTIRKPAAFRSYRKGSTDSVTTQSPDASKVTVPLDQHLHVSFPIADEDVSKSDSDLLAIYAKPAADALIRDVERAIASRFLQFSTTVGSCSTAPTDATLRAAGAALDNNSVPAEGRVSIFTPNQYQQLLDVARFVEADKSGDLGRAMQFAQLGYRGNFMCFKTNNMPSMTNAYGTSATTTTANAAKGATSFPVTAVTGMSVGTFLTLAGDVQPLMITNIAALVVTVDRPLRVAVASGAAVTIWPTGAINLAAGYAAGYRKDIAVDGFSVMPTAKHGVSIGGKYYGVLEADATSLMLDRPLEAAAADDAKIGAMPTGEYGFCGIPEAVAFVCRPLQTYNDVGAKMKVVSDPVSKMSVRTSLQYDGKLQQLLFTADLLCGTALVEDKAGVRFLS